MSKHQIVRAILLSAAIAFAGDAARAALDRAPELLEYRQVPGTNSVRLLWAPGGNTDGTLSSAVVSYSVERNSQTIFTGDHRAMTYVDAPTAAGSFTYRVKATTSDSQVRYSSPQVVALAYPLYPLDEALDGKVLLRWAANGWAPPPGHNLSGYRVERWQGAGWADVAGLLPLSQQTYIDTSGTVVGLNRYRVQARFTQGSSHVFVPSNEQEITINAMCAGQVTDPALPPLSVIEIGDRDADGDYTGADIVDALEECATKQYERIDGAGDDDGVCEAGESCVTGGCVLRALPVTYDDVAIKITSLKVFCTDSYSPSRPTHCLVAGPGLPLNFAAGLVIEGHGRRTVFRSPLWRPPYLPGAILEVHYEAFPVTLRNLVLDGRKHEQQAPGMSTWADWYHGGLLVWNQNPWLAHLTEISGDGLGDDDGYCDFETKPFPDKPCAEAASGNDGDGRCEAGEVCVDAEGGSCEAESWNNAEACVSNPARENSDGCVHNIEARNIFSAFAVAIGPGKRWIIEDSEMHDIGCVNRGYGYDCPFLEAAADAMDVLPGFKTFGIGLNIMEGTSDFQVRRNEVYRATKYGLSFKNGNASDCNNLLKNHEVSYNRVRDIGAVGIFNHGTVGARIHHNTIGRTTTWNEPQVMNSYQGPFGMSLGGYCSDNNVFSYNTITDSGGMGIYWNGSAVKVACSAPNSCAPVVAAGNTISNNTVDGTCLEKDTAPGTTNAFVWGSFSSSMDAAGPLLLKDNTLTDSQCRFALSAWGPRDPSVGNLDLEVVGGSYESGPNAATQAEGGFYCGAINVYGRNQKFVLGDGVRITNTSNVVPKASVAYGATLVIDDAPNDPFAPGQFSDPISGHEGSRVIE